MPPRVVDLKRHFDVKIEGVGDLGSLGSSVAGVGDVNRDGFSDVLLGAPLSSDRGAYQSGAAYLVLGRRARGRIAPDRAAKGVFRFGGLPSGSLVGGSVSQAGDFNGDGFPDLLMGAPGAPRGGAAYLVFGSRRPRDVSLSTPGSGVAAVVARGQRFIAQSVAGVGDVNRDGLSDIAVTALEPDATGSVYVVYGRRKAGPVGLGGPGFSGFRVSGLDPGGGDLGGVSIMVAGAGDVNGDGKADMIIGTSAVGDRTGKLVGAAYVVYGQRGGDEIDVRHVGRRGFLIRGTAETGRAVAGVGDMNADGLDDVAVGGTQPPLGVIFGRRSGTSINLRHLGHRGFLIKGRHLGAAVAGAGDVNHDGYADLVAGAPLASPRGRGGEGAAYVVYGSRHVAHVDVGRLGRRGMRIDGPEHSGDVGVAVAGAGDFAHDHVDDLVVGGDTDGRNQTGAAYVVFGHR